MLGIALSPVSPYVVALIVAFGAGALLFAVTVELYGEQLKHLEEHGHHQEGVVEVGITLFAAMCGAFLYIALNRYVEELGEGHPEHKEGDAKSDSASTSAVDVERGGSNKASPEATPREEGGERKSLKTGSKWKKTRSKVLLSAKMSVMESRRSKYKLEQTMMAVKEGNAQATTLAFGMFVGVLADGLPEAILIGFLASAGKLSMMFILSLFIANFPESFSASSIMAENQTFSSMTIVAMWTVPCILPSLLSAAACYCVPEDVQGLRAVEIVAASIEGLAGGMMMAMIASVMLPEAFNMAKKSENIFNKLVAEEYSHHGADVPGVLCVAGFLVAVGMKVTGGVLHRPEPGAIPHGGAHHFFFF